MCTNQPTQPGLFFEPCQDARSKLQSAVDKSEVGKLTGGSRIEMVKCRTEWRVLHIEDYHACGHRLITLVQW